MTQQEFTDRTGLTPTEMEFQYVHDIYMQTNLNKDMFCKDYKKHGKSEIVEELYGKLAAKKSCFRRAIYSPRQLQEREIQERPRVSSILARQGCSLQ